MFFRSVGLLLIPLSALAAEPKLPVPEAVKGGLLERVESPASDAAARFNFRLQDMGSVPGPLPGSRIHKLRDFENKATCYVLVPEGGKPAGGSLSCVRE